MPSYDIILHVYALIGFLVSLAGAVVLIAWAARKARETVLYEWRVWKGRKESEE